MKDKNGLNEKELEQATGGIIADAPRQLYSVGDKVTLLVYPEYGVGTVTGVQLVSGSWSCVVQFGDNTVTADQSEFRPAP